MRSVFWIVFPVKSLMIRGMRRFTFALSTSLLRLCRISAQETAESFVPNFAAGNAYYLWSSEASFDDGSGLMQNEEAGFYVPIPLVMEESVLAVAELRFRYNQLDLTEFAPIRRRLDLYRLAVPFNLWWDTSEKWKFWIRAVPALQSDFEHLTEDDFALTAFALASYQLRERLRFSFGAFYSNAVGDEWVLPAIGLIWEPTPQWVYNLTFPRLSITYAPVDGLLLTAFGNIAGSSWNVTDPVTGRDFDLDYESIRVGVRVEKEIRSPFWAFLEGGYQFGQSLETDFFEEREAEGSGFVSGGVQLRF